MVSIFPVSKWVCLRWRKGLTWLREWNRHWQLLERLDFWTSRNNDVRWITVKAPSVRMSAICSFVSRYRRERNCGISCTYLKKPLQIHSVCSSHTTQIGVPTFGNHANDTFIVVKRLWSPDTAACVLEDGQWNSRMCQQVREWDVARGLPPHCVGAGDI